MVCCGQRVRGQIVYLKVTVFGETKTCPKLHKTPHVMSYKTDPYSTLLHLPTNALNNTQFMTTIELQQFRQRGAILREFC